MFFFRVIIPTRPNNPLAWALPSFASRKKEKASLSQLTRQREQMEVWPFS